MSLRTNGINSRDGSRTKSKNLINWKEKYKI